MPPARGPAARATAPAANQPARAPQADFLTDLQGEVAKVRSDLEAKYRSKIETLERNVQDLNSEVTALRSMSVPRLVATSPGAGMKIVETESPLDGVAPALRQHLEHQMEIELEKHRKAIEAKAAAQVRSALDSLSGSVFSQNVTNEQQASQEARNLRKQVVELQAAMDKQLADFERTVVQQADSRVDAARRLLALTQQKLNAEREKCELQLDRLQQMEESLERTVEERVSRRVQERTALLQKALAEKTREAEVARKRADEQFQRALYMLKQEDEQYLTNLTRAATEEIRLAKEQALKTEENAEVMRKQGLAREERLLAMLKSRPSARMTTSLPQSAPSPQHGNTLTPGFSPMGRESTRGSTVKGSGKSPASPRSDKKSTVRRASRAVE